MNQVQLLFLYTIKNTFPKTKCSVYRNVLSGSWSWPGCPAFYVFCSLIFCFMYYVVCRFGFLVFHICVSCWADVCLLSNSLCTLKSWLVFLLSVLFWSVFGASAVGFLLFPVFLSQLFLIISLLSVYILSYVVVVDVWQRAAALCQVTVLSFLCGGVFVCSTSYQEDSMLWIHSCVFQKSFLLYCFLVSATKYILFTYIRFLLWGLILLVTHQLWDMFDKL